MCQMLSFSVGSAPLNPRLNECNSARRGRVWERPIPGCSVAPVAKTVQRMHLRRPGSRIPAISLTICVLCMVCFRIRLRNMPRLYNVVLPFSEPYIFLLLHFFFDVVSWRQFNCLVQLFSFVGHLSHRRQTLNRFICLYISVYASFKMFYFCFR